MLNEFVFLQLTLHFNNQYLEGMFWGLWWVQDGAPAHRLVEVRDCLNAVFVNNHIIGFGHNVKWPLRSPDLKPCDFSLGISPRQSIFDTTMRN